MPTPKTKTKNPVGESLNKLESIVEWFETRQDIDVEEGLKRVREGAELIKQLKAQLKTVENEFNDIKKGIEE